jgi:hypothetical protein
MTTSLQILILSSDAVYTIDLNSAIISPTTHPNKQLSKEEFYLLGYEAA